MHRLAATVCLDLRLQMRNGFYYAVAFVLACWFVLLTSLPVIDWGYVLPAVVFGNLVMVNFYFVAGLVLLEKDEGTLEAQVVTPLADWEYLASKTVTLAALSVVEQVVIVWSAYGGGFAGGAPESTRSTGPSKLFWMLEAGEPRAWLYFLAGLTYQSLLIAILLRRFKMVIAR